MNMPCKLLAAAVLATGAAAFAAPAGAAPIAAPSSLHNAAANVQTVQWRRGWRGNGWAPAAVAGAIVGGAIAAAQPWNYGYYDNYAYGPGYAYAPGYAYGPAGYNDYAYAPGPAYAPGYAAGPAYNGGGDDDAYCSQRFRSYDPSSGTYMGYDGRRHSCP